MLIGELAGKAGTTIKALRYYEQEGLLHPRRAPNGYREYDEAAVAQVGTIKALLSLGLTANDLRAFLPCLGEGIPEGPICPDSARVIARKLTVVEEKIAALEVLRGRLIDVLAS
ncbi:MerR family transcriptional regulator [Nonomuraea guangzhouensis]|uniref:MerR family transcriptional regulator n=1 Tax=Nonomuraea guangzhouensis TaxID=1291555 RepID=A0ABW4GPQ0_9ACTN|nr:MerR family transcriptional regulator [Nonomuraea guangzhouensis]